MSFSVYVFDKQLWRKPKRVSTPCLNKVWWSIQQWRCNMCCLMAEEEGGIKELKHERGIGKVQVSLLLAVIRNCFSHWCTFIRKFAATFSKENIATLMKVSEVLHIKTKPTLKSYLHWKNSCIVKLAHAPWNQWRDSYSQEHLLVG